MKSCKSDIKGCKEMIERLTDDESISFNLQEIIDIDDVDIDTVIKHAKEIFPKFYEKYQKMKRQERLHPDDPSNPKYGSSLNTNINADLNLKNRK